MRSWRDIGAEMFEPTLDPRTEEKMLRGLLEPHEAPAEFARVAAVLRVAASAGATDPSPGTAAAGEAGRERRRRVIESMVAIISTELPSELASPTAPRPATAGSRRGTASLLPRLRLVAVACVGFLLASVGLAFAGALPGPAQDAASSMLAHVGIHVPHHQGETTTKPGPRTETSQAGTSPGASARPPGSRSGPASARHRSRHHRGGGDHGWRPSRGDRRDRGHRDRRGHRDGEHSGDGRRSRGWNRHGDRAHGDRGGGSRGHDAGHD